MTEDFCNDEYNPDCAWYEGKCTTKYIKDKLEKDKLKEEEIQDYIERIESPEISPLFLEEYEEDENRRRQDCVEECERKCEK
jgi:hypothetical protein